MSNRLLSGAAVVAFVLSFAAVPSVQAADEAYCKDYAREAVNQFRSAEKHRRCEGLVREEGGRWNANWKAHYDWCREVRRDQARAERNERKRGLDRCTRRY